MHSKGGTKGRLLDVTESNREKRQIWYVRVLLCSMLPSKVVPPGDKLVRALLVVRVSVSRTMMRSGASAKGSVT
jgi:DNA-binding GntR family transcriptional regulator